MIFKEKLKEENQQKKRIIDAKMALIQSSIDGYKLLKKSYIENNFGDEVERERRIIERKNNELKFLKLASDKKYSNIKGKINKPLIINENKDIIVQNKSFFITDFNMVN